MYIRFERFVGDRLNCGFIETARYQIKKLADVCCDRVKVELKIFAKLKI